MTAAGTTGTAAGFGFPAPSETGPRSKCPHHCRCCCRCRCQWSCDCCCDYGCRCLRPRCSAAGGAADGAAGGAWTLSLTRCCPCESGRCSSRSYAESCSPLTRRMRVGMGGEVEWTPLLLHASPERLGWGETGRRRSMSSWDACCMETAPLCCWRGRETHTAHCSHQGR